MSTPSMIRVWCQPCAAWHDFDASTWDQKPIPCPTCGEAMLWAPQKEVLDFAADRPATYVIGKVGSGKTRITIEHIRNIDARRVLIVSKKRPARNVWPREIHKYGLDGRVVALVDSNPKRDTPVKRKAEMTREALKVTTITRERLIVIVNYESCWRDPLRFLLLANRWDLVVLDEIHNIKAPGGKASKFFEAMHRRAARRLGLTGTPMPSNPLDIYAQYRFIDPSILGTNFNNFRLRVAVMGGYQNREVLSYINQDWLHNQIFKTGIEIPVGINLPPVHSFARYCKLSPEEWAVYRDIEHHFVAEVQDGLVTSKNALSKMMRIAQVANGFVKTNDGRELVVGTAKQELLADELEEIESCEPVVIFYRFKHDAVVIRETCAAQGRPMFECSGDRDELAEWVECPNGVIAVQVQAGGEGLNELVKSCYGIYFSANFSLKDYDQTKGRLDRPGQTRPVKLIHLVAEGTIDVDIYQAHEDKREIIDAVLQRYKGDRVDTNEAAA